MNQIVEWAVPEMNKVTGGMLPDDDARELLMRLAKNEAEAEINIYLSGLIEDSKEGRKFLAAFIERVAHQRKYEGEAKKVHAKTSKLGKQ